jgi:hypothetical protein
VLNVVDGCIPSDMAMKDEDEHGGPTPRPRSEGQVKPGPTIDVAAKVRGMWD